MGIKNMAAVESMGTSNESKVHTKNMKSLLEGFFFSLLICKNKKVVVQKDEKGNSRSRRCE